jgi:hypothetical protein
MEGQTVRDQTRNDTNTGKRSWWLIEIWQESRAEFKAILTHVLVFTALIGGLAVLHPIISMLQYAPEEKEVLLVVDFIAVAAAIVVYSVSFILKVIVLQFVKAQG